MDSGKVAEVKNVSDGVEITIDIEEASPDQDISIANDSMDAHSESTYSCINASSGGDDNETVGEQYSASHNGSFYDQDQINNYEHGQQCTPQTSEAPSNVSSESNQVTVDNNEYLVPNIGVEFKSEDHAYKCYNKYALMEGFSIRKDFVNRSKITGLVASRRYTCHRQGYGGPTKRGVNVNKPRKETRTGCLAHMTVTRQPNGKYRVIHFETRHNHEFVTSSTAHLLPSQKRISFVEAVEGESSSAVEPNGVPKLGMGFDSENDAYEFYNSYAARVGFSVRKDYANRSKIDGVVASRRYTCFREGYRQKDKRDLKVKRPRKETRVGCVAQLVISRQVDGRYRVTHFEEHHNHELVPAGKVRLLRSQKRSLTNNGKDALGSSGTRPRTLAQLLLTGVDLHEEFTFDPIDHEMKLKSKRTWNFKPDEEESIHHYFQSKKLKNPSFFYAVLLDVDDKMTNFLWADEKMLADYGNFGDVICFDTTYRLNRDSRPLVFLYGINNHKQVVVFCAALLNDDNAESFKWMFRMLMKTGSGKKPKTVLSDKNDAISEAISSEWPEAHHRLCMWQMYQKVLKRLNEVVSSESFSSDLSGCIFSQDEEDFVNSWKVMLDSYSLWENEFLHGIFEERENWALPYNKYMFSGNLEITLLLLEDSIASLKRYINFESHVLQFVKHFGRAVNEWRYKELEANYDMGQKMPRLMGDIIMLKQLREVYTPIIFEMFHQEYENCLNTVIGQRVETTGSTEEYKVSLYGEVTEHTVLYSCEGDSVACSCMKFESVGVLCSHALKVLDYRNIKIIPSRYVLKRWTRDARS